MEGPRLPPLMSTHRLIDEDKPDHPLSSAFHRPTASLPVDLPSAPDSSLSSVAVSHLRDHSLPNFSAPPLSPHHRTPELDTYVVHVPRDQVYWVPPPEQAKLAERRRKSLKTKKVGCSKRLTWFILILAVLAILFGITTMVITFAFRPVPPIFAVQKFAVKSQKSHVVSFDITLRADNPTPNMGVDYTQRTVSIWYKNKKLGNGKFPKLSQNASESQTVRLNLDGSKNAVLPDSKQPVKFVLKADLTAEYGMIGPVKRKRDIELICDVKVKGLDAKKGQIVSDNCESEFIIKK